MRPSIEAPNAEVIDASKSIVMPGFVDTHRHMWQGFLRNVLPDGSLQDYRDLVQRKFGATMTPDDVYVADLLSALGAIDTGVTTRARLVAHPQHAGPHRRGHQGVARIPACARCSPTATRRMRPGASGR